MMRVCKKAERGVGKKIERDLAPRAAFFGSEMRGVFGSHRIDRCFWIFSAARWEWLSSGKPPEAALFVFEQDPRHKSPSQIFHSSLEESETRRTNFLAARMHSRMRA